MGASSGVRYGGTLAWLAVTRPVEFADRFAGRTERKHQAPASPVAANRSDPLAAAHEVVEVESDCATCAETASVAAARIFERMEGQHHHDGGTALGYMLWTLVRHLKPERVVETGVARGVSSAFILDALDQNRAGGLWSVDLPPLNPGWARQTGAAIPDNLRGRWAYLRGASRRRLPGLLEELGGVDMFLHDGLHTDENMTFEFQQVWPYLRDGGVLVSDDADDNAAFVRFASSVDRRPLLVREPGKDDVVGLLRK